MPDDKPLVSARRRRTLTALVTIGLLTIGSMAGLLVVLTSTDLGRFKPQVEALLSRPLGLELRTEVLHVDVDLDGTAAVSARGVRLTNPARAADSELLTVDRLDGRLELWPLHDLRIAIRDLSVSGARVTVVVDEHGRANWATARTTTRQEAPRRSPTLEIGRAVLETTTASVATAGMDAPLEIAATRLELSTHPDGMVDLAFDGAIAGRDLDVRGTVGPMSEVLVAGAVRGDLEIASGPSWATLTGGFGRLRALARPDLRLDASAASLEDVAHLVGLPRITGGGGPVVLTCTLAPSDAGVLIVAHTTVGELEARVRGEIDALTPIRRCDLDLEASGPDLAVVAATLDSSRAPSGPFSVRGGLAWAGFPIRLRNLEMVVGADRLTVDGACGSTPGFVGTDLRLTAEGPDASVLGMLLGTALPSVPYQLSASVRRRQGGLDLAPLDLELGGDHLTATGTVGDGPRLRGTDLTVDAHGSSLELAGVLLGIDLPEGPFEISGGVEVESDTMRLRRARGVIMGVEVTADGRIGLSPGLEGTSLVATLSGPDAAIPLSLVGIDGGHGLAYVAAGAVHVSAGRVELEDVTASAGELHGAATGHVNISRPADDLELDLQLEGPRLHDLAQFGAPSDLPAAPFSVSGRLRAVDRCLGLDRFAVTVDRAHRIDLQGWLALAPGLVGTDLRLSFAGPDLGALGRICATVTDLPELPSVPYLVTVDAAAEEDGFELRELLANLGRSELEASGHVGPWPELAGTELGIRAAGADLAEAAELLGTVRLPPVPFSGAGRLSFSAQELRVDDLDLRLGGSDVGGQLRFAAEERPRVQLRLASDMLDLSEIRGPMANGADATSPAPDGRTREGRVFSDEPLSIPHLEAVDGELDWRIGDLRLVTTTVADVAFTATLDHGRLTVGPLDARGARGGSVQAALTLAPSADDLDLRAALSVEGARADLTLGTAPDPDRLAVVDAILGLEARGDSPHALAVSSSGHFIVSITGGKVNRGLVDRLGEGLVRSVLKTLNPFESAEATPVDLECAVLVARFADGRLVLEPMVVKTSNLTLVGHGAVNLATEELDFEWVAKPRKGIGLSASTLTNPYVKLSGTLANPSIGVKKMEALASTGVAVATGGLSLLGKGLYDRLSADEDVCGKALDTAHAVVSEEAPASRSPE